MMGNKLYLAACIGVNRIQVRVFLNAPCLLVRLALTRFVVRVPSLLCLAAGLPYRVVVLHCSTLYHAVLYTVHTAVRQ